MSSINYPPKHYKISKILGKSKEHPDKEVCEVIVGEYSDSGGMGILTEIQVLSKEKIEKML